MTRKIRLPKKLPEASPWEELASKKPEAAATKEESTTQEEAAPQEKSGKKSRFRQRLQAERTKKGILLLPPKSEQKIYRIKKALKSKGLPEDKIKEELRKVRRTEELKYRREMNDVCLKCRQRGHRISDCPTGGGEVQARICYKCGSDKHTSKKCPKKVEGYPYAKCFTCQKVGHLTKDCSQSTTGLYPKGGCCFICKQKTHKMSDCPENKNRKEEKESNDSDAEDKVVATLYRPGMSMDEELL